jgi:Rrf2 family protein
MLLSKSFGYALRGILYVALMDKDGRKVQLDEIAGKLSVPRYFLAKIMKKMVKEKILNSARGPYGGFFLNNKTQEIRLIQLVEITDGLSLFDSCVLRLGSCNAINPCPLHNHMSNLRSEVLERFSNTTIGDLVRSGNDDFLRSIA